MTKWLEELLTMMSKESLILIIVITITGTVVFVKNRNAIKEKLHKWRAHENNKETFRKMVYQNQEKLIALEEQRAIDVEQSIKHDEALKGSIDFILITIETISSKLDKMQKENKETKLAELKDKIGQLYRRYHELGKWNAMEEEAFRDLIKQYEANGGYNSFVHDIVIPESYTWEKTE